MSGWPERPSAAAVRRQLGLLRDCPYLFVGDAGLRGVGVFTARAVSAGSVLVADEDGSMHGRAMTLAAAREQGWSREHDLFQLECDLFLPPRGCFDDLFNHSCDPSGGWRLTSAGARFVAIRDLAPGDELTYDYSCHLLDTDEEMTCACEAPSCRGVVGCFEHLSQALRHRYLRLGVVSWAVRRSAA